jgi:hypothetical protein
LLSRGFFIAATILAHSRILIITSIALESVAHPSRKF